MLVTVTNCPVRFESGVRGTGSSVPAPKARGPTRPPSAGSASQLHRWEAQEKQTLAVRPGVGAAWGGVCSCPGHRALVHPTWILPSSSGKPSRWPSRRAPPGGVSALSSSGATRELAEESRMLGVNLSHAL